MDNPGIQYLLEQAGSALQASHQVVNQQAQHIAQLEEELTQLRAEVTVLKKTSPRPPAKNTAAKKTAATKR